VVTSATKILKKSISLVFMYVNKESFFSLFLHSDELTTNFASEPFSGRSLLKSRPCYTWLDREMLRPFAAQPSPLNPLVPSRAMVKTWMTCGKFAGFLAGGTLGGAGLNHKDSLHISKIPVLFFTKRTLNDASFFFV